jgi:hypothetical protein
MRSVPQSDVPQSPFLWSRGTAARETLRYLDRNGIGAFNHAFKRWTGTSPGRARNLPALSAPAS